MGDGTVAIAELPVIVALEGRVGVVVGDGKGINKSIGILDLSAQELIKSVFVDTLACHSTAEAP